MNTKNQINDTGFVYDDAGNLTAEPQKTYTYDAENRMTQSVVSGVTTTYSYEGDGKRVKKSSGKLYWYGMGSDPAEESNLSGVASADYIFFGGKRTARLDLLWAKLRLREHSETTEFNTFQQEPAKAFNSNHFGTTEFNRFQ